MKFLIGFIFFILSITLFILFLKVYVQVVIVYTDLKKEGTLGCSIFGKIIKLKINFTYVGEDLSIILHISFMGITFQKSFNSIFHSKKDIKSAVTVSVEENTEPILKKTPLEDEVNEKKNKIEHHRDKVEMNQTIREEIEGEGNGESHSEEKEETVKDKIFTFIKLARKFHTICKQFLKKVNIEVLSLQVTYGIEDAALTGKSLGVIWSIVGIVLGWINANFHLNCKPTVEFEPYYQGTMIKGTGNVTVSFRPLYGIYYGVKIYLFYKKEWKEKQVHASKDNRKGMEV